MSLKENIYFCNECKKVLPQVTDLLFVEEGSCHGFCSEECIEDFYTPLISHYEQKINQLKEKYFLSNEIIDSDHDDNYLVEEVSTAPDEIWQLNSELKEEVYFYIKRHHDFYIALVCTRFNQTPSFIFAIVKTKDTKFLNEFRVGERLNLAMEEEKEEEQIEAEMQFLEMLESKKSNLLGELLVHQKDSDISFEEFNKYEHSFNDTLTNPDEIYETKDREGDIVFHYLKSFIDKQLGNYFYIVVGFKKSNANDEVTVYPILSFPTNDLKLFQKFRIGERVHGMVKN